MDYITETIDYKGHTIEIGFDPDPQDPREWDCHLGTMICNHGKYDLGDEKFGYRRGSFIKDLRERLGVTASELERDYIVLPLYLYDHSGITINTTGYGCQWDSGQVGYIYVSKEEARKWFNVKRLNRNEVIQKLVWEVKEYDAYLTGQVYMFNIGEGACGGYYEETDAIAEAKYEIDCSIKYQIDKHIKYIKGCIKSKTNILYRNTLQLG